jgi:hypothetical protein
MLFRHTVYVNLTRRLVRFLGSAVMIAPEQESLLLNHISGLHSPCKW